MISALLSRINPFMLYVKIGVVLIVGLYIGWLNYCLMDAESDLQTEKAQTVILKRNLKDYAIAYDTLAKKTAEQNAQINAMHDETIRAKAKAEQAKKNAQSKIQAREKQMASIQSEATTCEQAIEQVKSQLIGSAL